MVFLVRHKAWMPGSEGLVEVETPIEVKSKKEVMEAIRNHFTLRYHWENSGILAIREKSDATIQS